MLRGIFSAKVIAGLIAIAMLVSTVSIYAASLGTTSAKRLGGSTGLTVGSAATAADVVDYTVNETTGKVTGVKVAWTSIAGLNGTEEFQVKVVLTNGAGTVLGSGSCIEANVAESTAKDSDLTITEAVGQSVTADAVGKASIYIAEQTGSPAQSCS